MIYILQKLSVSVDKSEKINKKELHQDTKRKKNLCWIMKGVHARGEGEIENFLFSFKHASRTSVRKVASLCP